MSPGFKTVVASCSLLLLIGCAVKQPPPVPPEPPAPMPVPTEPEPIPPEEPEPTPPEATKAPPQEKPTPRALASLELTKQARLLIEAGKPDDAIRILERAVNLHPGSGENYYYLAEAWRLKKNASQASEYNALAAIRFKDDPQWMERIALQKRRIGWIR